MFRYCEVFQCNCDEVKDIIKGYDVVCNIECHKCQECKDIKKEISEELDF